MRIETIKRRADFVAANAKCEKSVAKSFILQARLRPGDHPAGKEPRFGFTVTKKMGNAVIRNRIKRRLRAAIRKLPPDLAQERYDYVLISRLKALDCPFSELQRELEFAFSRIIHHKDDRNAGK